MHQSFLAVTILALGAAMLVWALQRVKLSPILAYLALGVMAAPFKGFFLGEMHTAEAIAEFGVILLMFFIGIEFHLDQLRAMLKLCLVGGSLQVVLTALAAGWIAYSSGASHLAAGVVGAMVAFSSTALVMKGFESRRESDSHRARVSLAILLYQDIAAIIAVVVLPLAVAFWPEKPGASGAANAWIAPLQQLAILLVLLPVIFTATRYVLPGLFEKAAKSREPELFTLISLSAGLLVGLAAHSAGASIPLGAFLGGLVLSRTPFTAQIVAELNTLRNLSLGFFFISVGMLVDLAFVRDNFLALLGSLALVVLLKTLIAGGSLLVLRTPVSVAAGVALPLSQIGEFSFVLGQQASNLGILPGDLHRFILALAVLSMLLTPFMTMVSSRFGAVTAALFARILGPRFSHWLETGQPTMIRTPERRREDHSASPSTTQVLTTHAIVVGYGPVGRTLTRILTEFEIKPVVIDMNIETVKKLKERGFDAVYGDAGRREILHAAKIEQATYLLVTLPDLPGRIPVVATARLMNPHIKIFVRARYLAERAMLEEAGSDAVGYEEAEVAVTLAQFLLKEIGVREEEIEQHAQRIRAEISMRTGFTMMMAPSRRKTDKH